MNGKKPRYDTELQMFCEDPHDADVRRLVFLRWLVEHERFDHGVMGPSSGLYAVGPQPVANPEIPPTADRSNGTTRRTSFWSGSE